MKRYKNLFQKEIVEKYPALEKGLVYFTEKSEEKIKEMGLPIPDCEISNAFKDCIYPNYYRARYCLNNCGLRCLRGLGTYSRYRALIERSDDLY